jgi:hypothetical protein
MMIRQSTRHGESMQKHGEIACTRCTETISMQNKEEMRLLLLRVIQACRRRSVQQLKYREEEWCIEWTWRTEHKRQKHRKHKDVCSKTVRQ